MKKEIGFSATNFDWYRGLEFVTREETTYSVADRVLYRTPFDVEKDDNFPETEEIEIDMVAGMSQENVRGLSGYIIGKRPRTKEQLREAISHYIAEMGEAPREGLHLFALMKDEPGVTRLPVTVSEVITNIKS